MCFLTFLKHYAYSYFSQKCTTGICYRLLQACVKSLQVHKNENFFCFDFEFCTVSLLIFLKYEGSVTHNF
jgi:hypothetical protein